MTRTRSTEEALAVADVADAWADDEEVWDEPRPRRVPPARSTAYVPTCLVCGETLPGRACRRCGAAQ